MHASAMVFWAGLGLLASAPAPPSSAGDLPPGWFRAGDHPADYEMAVDPKGGRTGKACAFIKGKGESPGGFGTLMQTIDAAEYRGKRLRFSAQVKAAGITSWAGLWMRIDGPAPPESQVPAMLGFDNMGNRPIKGTADWKRSEVVLDVPPEAKAIAFGILLGGSGQAWIDELQLLPVGPEIPVTQTTGLGSLPKKPNLSFER
jgi:hypothetical protein